MSWLSVSIHINVNSQHLRKELFGIHGAGELELQSRAHLFLLIFSYIYIYINLIHYQDKHNTRTQAKTQHKTRVMYGGCTDNY
jgi:hypothetical protein